MATLDKTIKSLAAAARDAEDWFRDAAVEKTREQFNVRKGIGDNGSGAVYAYFDEMGNAIYVGESGRRFKLRLYDKTSPQAKSEWWPMWKTVKFMQVQNRTDRIALEMLLILAVQPKFNTKPGARMFDVMFKISN